MFKTFKTIYNSIHLNTGIKRKISAIGKILEKQMKFFDTRVLLPVYRKLEDYFYKKASMHYGADYHWGDERSQNLDKKTANYGYGLLHHAIIRNQRPKRILCVGSMYGFIPFMMAKGCAENGKGVVDFVDAGYDINDKADSKRHFFGKGFWKSSNPKKHFSYLLDRSYVKVYVMKLERFIKKHGKRRYDYIYLDGDHSYKGAKKALSTLWPRLNERGLLCLHDIHFELKRGDMTFDHWRVWEELIKTSDYKIEFSNLYSGLGFIQKNTKPRARHKDIS